MNKNCILENVDGVEMFFHIKTGDSRKVWTQEACQERLLKLMLADYFNDLHQLEEYSAFWIKAVNAWDVAASSGDELTAACAEFNWLRLESTWDKLNGSQKKS